MIGIGWMMKTNILQISEYLDELFTNPKCELNYQKDYELLLAVMMSAPIRKNNILKMINSFHVHLAQLRFYKMFLIIQE